MRASKLGLLASGAAVVVAAVAALQFLRDDEGPHLAASSREAGPAPIKPIGGSENGGDAAATEDRDDLAATITSEDPSAARADDLAPCEPLVIRGRVVAAEGGRPIAGAEVATDRRFDGAVRTDEAGDYSLTMPPNNFYEIKVEARAPGFGRREARIGEIPGTEVTVDFELMAARRASGRLTGPDGAPVAGAEVSAHASIDGSEGDMIDRVETRSAADGTFLLADLRPDLTHLLRVRKPGFAAVVYAFPQHEKSLDVVEFGELALAREHSIEVLVADESGAPISDVQISLTGGNGDWLRFSSIEPLYNRRDLWSRSGASDASGRCRFDELAAGSWSLSAYRRDHVGAANLVVAIREADAAVPVTITLPRGLSISGRVVDESGRRVGKANVYVMRRPAVTLWLVADEAGEFRATGLEPGGYRVTCDERWFEHLDETGALKIGDDVAAGSEEVVIVSRPAPTDVIRGIVRDRSGKPVAFASVKAFFGDGRETGIAMQSRVGGRFALAIPKGASVRLIAGPRDAWPPAKDDGYDLTGFPAVTADARSGEVTLTYFEPPEDR